MMIEKMTISSKNGAYGTHGTHRAYGLRLLLCLLMFIVQCSMFNDVYAQKIGGNVYGGGNKGDVRGKSTVTVKSGDIDRVFGGARMANVGERTYVYINGKNRENPDNTDQNTNTGNILINQVYGGNDIAGTIGTSEDQTLEAAVDSLNDEDIYSTYNTFVRIDAENNQDATGSEAKSTTTDAVYIGSLFAGGNGDYTYENTENSHNIYDKDNKLIASNSTGFQKPELDKTYLEIDGGSIVYAFGGGNNATVRKNTVIHVNNPTDVVNSILVDGVEQLTDERIAKMGTNPGFTYATSADYQIGSLFGGNNKATMAIRPTWDLQSGLIRNVYSGGNKGDMTSPVGLLLEVNPTVVDPRKPLEIDNIYGGCRMADVHPLKPGTNEDMNPNYVDLTDKDANNQRIYNFPAGLAARTLVRGGKINNVYGGNDIRGKVWGGNAIGIYTSINGNIYGGGNGAYPYTDNKDLASHPTWSDLYYDPKVELTNAGVMAGSEEGKVSGLQSLTALNLIRPHAEQVSIRLSGTENKKTIIRGKVFLGGNCATLKNNNNTSPRVEIIMGSYVIAENLFLGNNGEHMVDIDNLKHYAGYVKDKDVSLTTLDGYKRFSSIDLTDADQMSKYMEAVTLDLKPKISIDSRLMGNPADYIPYSSWIGSFYAGGNVGSMTYAGPLNLKLEYPINVYEKIVGGCNNADVDEKKDGNTLLCAKYYGGILGSAEEQEDYTQTTGEGDNAKTVIKDRLIIDCDQVLISPKRWNNDKTELIWNTVTWQDTYTPVESGTTLTSGNTYYTKKTGTTDEYEAYTAIGTETADEDLYYEYAGGYAETDTGEGTGEATTADLSRRLKGGNLYGGCYHSGHVNGNVVINLNNNLTDRQEVFAQVAEDDDRPLYDHEEDFSYHITQRNSGVILDEQGMDEMASALSIFGGGYGKDSEIWGSTTINIKRGYSFQIYGGGEQGVIGQSLEAAGVSPTEPLNDTPANYDYLFPLNQRHYKFDPAYSTTVNLFGEHAGATRAEDNTIYIAESEFIYGGGYEGPVTGDTRLYLGNGRIFDAFAGGCNADILGHSETYVGKAWNFDKETPGYDDGFPHIRDYVYGGNDLGGRILGSRPIGDMFLEDDKDKTYRSLEDLEATTYVEYLQGYCPSIYGGCYGAYDYDEPKYIANVKQKPYIHNSVVNFRPKDQTTYSSKSSVRRVFGAGEGASGQRYGDSMQEHSYVHVHIPDAMDNFATTEVFGAGNYYGVGMSHYVAPATASETDLEEASAIIDLVGGQIAAAYGGSYNEGITRRTEVNVPEGSTIKIGKIFGGAYGTNALPPCDVYESNVNFASGDALVTGGIYGGNNNVRRTLYSKVNISSPVWSDKAKGYLANVYGAGYGTYTWSEYTEVNLLPGANVYEVYGGGQLGQVLNAESVQAYMTSFINPTSLSELPEHIRALYDPADFPKWGQMWKDAWTLGTFKNDNVNVNDNNSPPTTYYTPSAQFTNYVDNAATNLSNVLARTAEIDDREPYDETTNPKGPSQPKKYNTNVIIHEGATVSNYAYGGGLGDDKVSNSGDVLGSTYIALLGGTVKKDIYAAGTTGNVYNIYGGTFTASTTAYIKGGSARNVYGGGWKGSVGSHTGTIAEDPVNDVPGETHVVIGILNDELGANPKASTDSDYDPDYFFHNGIPTIQRNAYGGGEGGAVYGSTHLTFNNGYVGYVYDSNRTDNPETTDVDERYVEKIEDETHEVIPNTRLNDAGCIFGGGYVDNSSVDFTNVMIFGGHVRNSAFGGGEIAAVGRGAITETRQGDNIVRTLSGLYRPGKTHIEMYGGHVYRNVYGGGRGYDNLGGYGLLHADGCVFGQTEVRIHGGEIGSAARMNYGDGNVFGGGDIGYVYSAYENDDGSFGKGVKDGVRYDGDKEGYYYKHTWKDTGEGSGFIGTDERILTEDCKVLVEPHCKVTSATTINGKSYNVGEYVPTAALNTLAKKSADDRWNSLDPYGIVIHNAVFAGGNTPSGKSVTNANVASVFGNATASINDVYHRDLISLGANHIGGLYGDGNLTLVDGYRELNITNYGTDYYAIEKEISIDEYKALPDREADYYELKFTCIEDCTDKEGTDYKKSIPDGSTTTKASTITYDELLTLFLTEKKDAQGNIIYIEGTQTPEMESITDNYNGKDIAVLKKENDEWKPNTDADDNPLFWEESGVLPVYAGRPMNTIQRADFCGVWGSRMVMQGARDRVPDEVDLTNYTINRVREVSLNKKESERTTENDNDITNPDTGDDLMHGNYFGIYNIVNYLGALTSDVDFGGESDTNNYGDIRVTDNANKEMYGPDLTPDGASITLKTDLTNEDKEKTLAAAAAITGVTVDGETITASTVEALYKLRSLGGLEITGTPLTNQTYYDWKKLHHDERKRNNGNSHNKVALASGVYLEITSEKSTGTGLYEKDWGPITGVVELDLINVTTGIGGGFVYAKNIHGVRSKNNHKNEPLTALNHGAVTHQDYEYDPDDSDKNEWQSSGNFVHSTQTIIDDCYNISGKYQSSDAVPAHYWYIKGSIYVYDQYISAHTGSPNAFSEAVDIPLTITAASHGSMKLLDVKPNRYAYYSQPGVKLTGDKKISIGDKTYSLNDPISYWDWYLMSASERALFIENTYVNCVAVNIDDETENGEPKIYAPGTYVMNENEFNSFGTHTYKNAEGEVIQDADKNTADKDYIFRPSNNLGHNTGYILTYQVNNPGAWDTWYSPKTGDSNTGKRTKKAYNALDDKENYEDGPTYTLDTSKLREGETSKVLGQSNYKVGDLISKNIQDAYPYTTDTKPEGQADFKPAYIITEEVTIQDKDENNNDISRHLNPGATISETQKNNNSSVLSAANCDEAYICTKTIQLSKTEYIYMNTKMSETEKDNYIARFTTENPTNADTQILKDLNAYLVLAYYCTEAGKYGGSEYKINQNYRGLETWSSMSESDREYFIFNYDALDLLIDPTYGVTKTETGQTIQKEGEKYQYDGKDYTTKEQANDNQAQYSLDRTLDYYATYKGNDTGTYNEITLAPNTEYNSRDYESLPNEQRHYVAIHVKDGKLVEETTGEGDDAVTTSSYKVYVVNHSFQIGNTPYAVGATISYDTYAGLTDKDKITELTFPANESDNTYYYCRKSYKVGYNGSGIPVTNLWGTEGFDEDGNSFEITKNEEYKNGDQVPIGLVIGNTDYAKLVENNKQKNFTFHGTSPTETSTLYVSKESDIYNLSKDKIITVIYQYDYEESDNSGNVTPVSERHVLNIHIKFESGVPVVEDITKPDIILPGDFITIGEPNVIPGAYEVIGGGWELFETPRDAESHVNGREYSPTFDPLYWYQHDWYVAYYAKSYLGRTYSNAVPVSVANYHDIADVMSDGNKEHHMYIDHPNMKRDPKIYLNDYSTLPNTDTRYGKNALDEFKRLFDLSILDKNSANANGVVTSGDSENPHPLEGHHLLIDNNYRDRALRNLEFFLRTDIDHTGSSWTPIGGNDTYDNPATTDDEAMPTSGTKGECFDGVFHGDGHTISGLDKSLFAHLCGEVYNLGVTGSFTGAGIADTGYGYIENCWIKSSATETTETTETKPKAIFGAPLATGFEQVVNCYYPGSNEELYDNKKSTAHKVPDKDFYNGEVAYNLNGFYLYKRYNDNISTWGNSPVEYQYWKAGETEPQTGYYGTHQDYCSSGYNGQQYVEDRFADGDFRYAGGNIPEGSNERLVTDEEGKPHYYPIWPDDYLFFGQSLNYGYVDTRSHQDLPSYIWRSGSRLATAENSNRVYRAPAYFRNSVMDVAHFNPYAVFANTKKGDATVKVYDGMTAIDFSGGNGDLAGGYKLGFADGNYKHFYQPLLDDDGLINFRNEGLTKNLLVYTDNAANPSTTASGITANKIKSIVIDPTYTETNSDYRTVAYQQFATINGHWVQKKDEPENGIEYESLNDHLLVDKNDFNAPMAYTFDTEKRMYHQRTPANYVDRTSGWEAISLPFTADLVTTDTKGEITHFYNGSDKSLNSESKIGHEYWLRELDEKKDLTQNTDATETLTANFQYPYAKSSDKDKDVSNTFLWDYYYEAAAGHNRKDANKDTYQEYYNKARTYPSYARLTCGTPYIIGFPGITYYEFDLSGTFEATTAYSKPERIKQQVITFASPTGTTIKVSDQELKDMERSVKYGNTAYIFKPSYLNEELAPYPAEPAGGTTYDVNFALNNDGSSFALVKGTAQNTEAFRPFFTSKKTAAANAREFNYIDFANITDGTMEPDEDVLGRENGFLEVYARGRKIVTASHLKEKITVHIVSVSGAVLKTYVLEPGKTEVTPVTAPGAYIVNKKKLFIK